MSRTMLSPAVLAALDRLLALLPPGCLEVEARTADDWLIRVEADGRALTVSAPTLSRAILLAHDDVVAEARPPVADEVGQTTGWSEHHRPHPGWLAELDWRDAWERAARAGIVGRLVVTQ